MYGNSINVFSCVESLLTFGVPGQKILLVECPDISKKAGLDTNSTVSQQHTEICATQFRNISSVYTHNERQCRTKRGVLSVATKPTTIFFTFKAVELRTDRFVKILIHSSHIRSCYTSIFFQMKDAYIIVCLLMSN